MNKSGKIFVRVMLTVYLLLVHAAAAAFLIQQFVLPRINLSGEVTSNVQDPTASTPVPTPLPVPSEFYDPEAANANLASNSLGQPAAPGKLMIPVLGIKPEQLVDTFSASRSAGRVHEAIDIIAPAGTPVIAAADGKILKFHDSVPGGITIYQLSSDEKFIYYYGHLQRRADGLKEGDVVRQGSTIGFVGDTGNSGAGNYHLHFAISIPTDPKRFWEGDNINPYPLLTGSAR